MLRDYVLPGLVLFLLATLAGCQINQPVIAPPQPTVIPVSLPVQREVTDYEDFTGRTNAVETVNIIPRVTGYLDQIAFEDGKEVKKGDLLFQVDPRPYKAQLDQAEGQVKLYQARLQLAKTTYERDKAIAKTPGAVSLQQLDQDMASVQEAEAQLKATQASTEVYKLNLDFTNVKSPVTGQVSRHLLSIGNLVNQDQTLLTTVVSLDPMYVYFDMDESTLLRIRNAINAGKIVRYQQGKVPIFMGLQGEDGYPHEGTVNFVDNQVNSNTASISVRGVFANPKPPEGVRLLAPGMFVRVRLPIGRPHPALLVIDRAIGSDQGLKYVYVVDDQNMVQSRRVQTGTLQEDGLRVITDGLKATDWVVVGALPQVRPRMIVQVERVTMPTLNQPADVTGKTNGATGTKKK
jgi:membrane fusion protein, multidrug efflux system